MNIGCCISHQDENKLRIAKKVGLDFVEASFSGLGTTDKNSLDKYTSLLAELNLPCVSTNGMLFGDFRLTGPNADLARAGDFVYKTLDYSAKAVGYKYVVFGSSGARNVPNGFSHEEATEQITKFLAEYVAPAMREFGVVCLIEELCPKETNIIQTCAEAMKIIKAVNLPEIKLLIDYYHTETSEEPVESLEAYVPYTKHVHIASPRNSRRYPIPEDGDDYKKFFDILRSGGYTEMNISLEGGANGDFEKSLSETFAYLKSL